MEFAECKCISIIHSLCFNASSTQKTRHTVVFEREDGLLLLELIKSKLERKCDEFLLELTSIFDDVNFEGTSRTNMLFPPLFWQSEKKG